MNESIFDLKTTWKLFGLVYLFKGMSTDYGLSNTKIRVI